MSEQEKAKKEMIELLEKIPTSGSFQRAELAIRVSELSKSLSLNSLVSAPEPPSKDGAPQPAASE
jgi:hypothetical protein